MTLSTLCDRFAQVNFETGCERTEVILFVLKGTGMLCDDSNMDKLKAFVYINCGNSITFVLKRGAWESSMMMQTPKSEIFLLLQESVLREQWLVCRKEGRGGSGKAQ